MKFGQFIFWKVRLLKPMRFTTPDDSKIKIMAKLKLSMLERKQKTDYAKEQEDKFQNTLKQKREMRVSSYLAEPIKDLLKVLLKKSKKLEKNVEEFTDVVAGIYEYRGQWVRDPREWKAESYSYCKLIVNLCQWVFCKYPVPIFLASVWQHRLPRSRTIAKQIEWFLLVAKGKSLKTHPTFPDMTAKMRHLFMTTPASYTVSQAVWRAAALALGADKGLSTAVVGSVLSRNFTEHVLSDFKYWLTLIQFFINNPMLSPSQFDPFCDFINMIREQPQRVKGELIRKGDPSWKEFKLAGRNPLNLIRDMEVWHTHTTKMKGQHKYWDSCGLEPFEYEEGTEYNKIIWRIEEILTQTKLSEEGCKLHHCVASYAGQCASGRCSIWSLTRNGERQLTIQLSLPEYYVGQVRGLQNRMPNPREERVLAVWKAQRNLK